MEGKEAIIAGILEKAEAEAKGLISAAQAEREEMLASVRDAEERKAAAALERAREQADAVLKRRATLDTLDARKAELAAKQQVIDAAFEEAVHKIHKMTDPVYREFTESLLIKYADDGDSVVVAARDVKRLHAEWLEGVSRKCGKHLRLSSDTHDGEGGVILVGAKCDKNLTLEAMLKSLRTTALTGAAKRLFG